MSKLILDFSKNIDFSSINFDENWKKDIFSFLQEWFDENKIIYVKTSGSTGKPKLIKLKKKSIIKSAERTNLFFNLKETNISLLCISPNFIAGKMMLIRSIIAKMKIICVKPSSNPLEKIKEKIDFSAMFPIQISNSLEELNLIKNLIIGGGEISEKIKNKLIEKKTNCFQSYGMSETISHIALKNIKKTDKYHVLTGVKISKNIDDCLIINDTYISNNEIVTNDIVKIFDKERFIWKGRFDNIINSGGLKISPEEIEGKLDKIIDKKFFISKLKDDILGEKIILIIEGLPFCTKNIKNKMIAILPKYHIPKEIFFVKNFELTKTTKIKRNDTIKNIIFEK